MAHAVKANSNFTRSLPEPRVQAAMIAQLFRSSSHYGLPDSSDRELIVECENGLLFVLSLNNSAALLALLGELNNEAELKFKAHLLKDHLETPLKAVFTS